MKRNLATIIALVLIVCMLVPATALAASTDTYKVTFELMGPNAGDVLKTVTANYNYVPGSQTLLATFQNWAYDNLAWAENGTETPLATVFAGTGMKAALETFIAAAKGDDDAAWQAVIADKTDADTAAKLGDRSIQLYELEEDGSFVFNYGDYELTVSIVKDTRIYDEGTGGGSSGSATTTPTDVTTGEDGTTVKETTDEAGNTVEVVDVADNVTETTLPVDAEDGVIYDIDIPDGKTVEVTLPMEGDRLVVYQILPDGTKQALPIVAETEKGLKLTLNDDVKIVVEQKTDDNGVDQDAWYAEAMNLVYDNDMDDGIPDAELDPESDCNRGTFTTLLYNMYGKQQVSGAGFNDTESADYFDNASAWGQAMGIIKGEIDEAGNIVFNGEGELERQQMVTILWRIAGCPAVTPLSGVTSDETCADYVNSMSWAISVGLIQGDEGGYRPGETASVAESAQMIKNFIDGGYAGVSNR